MKTIGALDVKFIDALDARDGGKGLRAGQAWPAKRMRHVENLRIGRGAKIHGVLHENIEVLVVSG